VCGSCRGGGDSGRLGLVTVVLLLHRTAVQGLRDVDNFFAGLTGTWLVHLRSMQPCTSPALQVQVCSVAVATSQASRGCSLSLHLLCYMPLPCCQHLPAEDIVMAWQAST